MEIVDLTVETLSEFLVCLEPWSPEMRDAGDAKRLWYEREKDRGLRVKLARDKQGVVAGQIQYVPIERSLLEGRDGYFVQCLWVHGHAQGQGDRQGRGIGRALLEAAEKDVRERGGKGLATQGLLVLPFWQRAAWFRRHGYRRVDRLGLLGLMWKPFSNEAEAPRWIRPKAPPRAVPGRVTVTAYVNGWCSAQNIAAERARRAAVELGDKVEFRRIEVPDREALRREGHADAVFIDGASVRNGPPPAYETIRRMIEERVRRLGWSCKARSRWAPPTSR